MGSTVKEILMTNFNTFVGGRELIKDGSITLSHGRHYGLIGRNGTGKTTLLRHMALHAIDGIPKNCQILHVEQEVVGDDTIAVQCVLNSDVESGQPSCMCICICKSFMWVIYPTRPCLVTNMIRAFCGWVWPFIMCI
jgi:translation initiation factor RLI1